MGLDMFLNKRKKKNNSQSWEDIIKYSKEEEVIYWRKANQIHRFFVSLYPSADDGEEIPVTDSDLISLYSYCEEVLENPDKAKDILPTQEGFFFGSTDYDDGYFDDIKFTFFKLKELINSDEFKSDNCQYSYYACIKNNTIGKLLYSTVVSADISFKELFFSILESFKEANLQKVNTYDYYSIYNPNDYLEEFDKNYSYYLKEFVPDFNSHINEIKNLKSLKTDFYNFCDSFIKNLDTSLMCVYSFYKEQGYILDFTANFPWLYLTSINKKPVNIIYNSEHGCTIGFLKNQYSIIKSLDVSIIDKLIKSKNYEPDI